MSDINSECDAVEVVLALIVFALPLTLLIPGFTLWDVVPKVQIFRFHLVSQYLTWAQLSSAIACMLALFFCLYLEIRKRNLDDMLEKVLTVSQATDMTMEEEQERQAAAMKVCVELLETSSEHYEHLVLLRDELRKREKPKKQMPPVIEPSSSDM